MRLFTLVLIFVMGCKSVAQTHSHEQSPPKNSSTVQVKPPVKTEEPRVAVEVPENQQARIGVKTTKVKKKIVEHMIRTVGTVTADQTKEAHVHTRINGWIEKIYADYVGKPVRKGQPLFDLYSPDLVSTQEEYLSSRKHGTAGKEIAIAAAERLKLWSVPESELRRLKSTGKSKRALTFESPVDGVIINKTAIQGMYVTSPMELYHIADLSRVWIVITLYEYDVAAISVGDEVDIKSPYDAKLNVGAKISYIYPEIEPETRSARARVEIDNKNQSYKPGMYVNVTLRKNLGEAIVVPEDAVIDTGLRKIVFVKVSRSRFEPREIRVGPRVSNEIAVISGLKLEDEVVTSAHFFLDAESKLRGSAEKGGSHQHGGQ